MRRRVHQKDGAQGALQRLLEGAQPRIIPTVVDLFDVDAPEGSETQRIKIAREEMKARRLYERSAARCCASRMCCLPTSTSASASMPGLDFDDLIETAGRLLTRQHAAEWVLWKLDGGISQSLLDEAQDTSPPQWKILEALTIDIFAGAYSGAPGQAEAYALCCRRPEAVDLFLPGRRPRATSSTRRSSSNRARGWRMSPSPSPAPRHVVPLGAVDLPVRR